MAEKLLKDLYEDQKKFYKIKSDKTHTNIKTLNYEDL
jgi:hypothetical protein